MAVSHWGYRRKCLGWALKRTRRSLKAMFGIPALAFGLASFVRVWIQKGIAVALENTLTSVGVGLAGGLLAVLMYVIWHLALAPAELDAQAQDEITRLEDKRNRQVVLDRLGELYEEGCALAATAVQKEASAWLEEYNNWVSTTYAHIVKGFSEAKAALFRNIGSRPLLKVAAPEEIQVEGRALHYQLETLRQFLGHDEV